MVKFLQAELNIGLKEIEEIEKFVGLEFPNEYREHLLQYNGGQCTPNVFSFMEKGMESNSCVDWFLAIYNGEYDNLKKYIQIYKLEEKRLPSHILPIAHDPLGNLICISCGTTDNGGVYFWDHENEVNYSTEKDNNYSNLYLIAKGFNNFLDSLK
jgi:hypothetical protein